MQECIPKCSECIEWVPVPHTRDDRAGGRKRAADGGLRGNSPESRLHNDVLISFRVRTWFAIHIPISVATAVLLAGEDIAAVGKSWTHPDLDHDVPLRSGIASPESRIQSDFYPNRRFMHTCTNNTRDCPRQTWRTNIPDSQTHRLKWTTRPQIL